MKTNQMTDRNNKRNTKPGMGARRLGALLALAAVALTGTASAAPMTFNFKDPKGVNNAVFKLDAPLEAINGSASGVSGTVTFDPANPGATQGKIVVEAKSLHVPNPLMKEHLHGDQWLNVAKHGEITFEAKSLKNVKTAGDSTTADAVGVLTIKGVSKDVTVPVKLTYLKDKLAARTGGQMQGDLLVIRSNFSIQRADFEINPKAPADKVAETIDLTLSIAGASPR
jgi:polyisoprenoid-binding protein YceI